MIKSSLPLIGFAAFSGTGKTTLLCKLIPLLKKKGIRVGIIKHAHHDFEIDHPNKDSCKLRQSGATKTVVSSKTRTAIIIEHPDNDKEPTLEDALKNIRTKNLDLILVEGFKQAQIPKIELHREALKKPYIHTKDKNIIAVASDHSVAGKNTPIVLDLNQPQQIADFISEYLTNVNARVLHQLSN